MNAIRASALGAATLISSLALSAPSATAARRPLTGRVLVYTEAFSLRIWDPVNGVHQIDSGVGSGGSPSITSDGRLVAYGKNDSHGCYSIHVWDTQLRRRVRSLSGLGTPGQCNDSTHISPDGKFLVWSSAGAMSGDPYDIYLYDIATGHRIPLPATINTGAEITPSLAHTASGHYLLSYIQGNPGGWDQVQIADLGVDPPTTAAAAAPMPTPGLPVPSDGRTAQEQAQISADGSAVTYVTGPLLGTQVWIYDRTAGTASSPAILAGPNYQQQPSVSASGRYVVEERERKTELTSHLWVYDRLTGALTPATPTRAGAGETLPAIADPAILVDLTPPKLTLKCSRRQAKISCTLAVNEAISGTATLLVAGHKQAARKLSAATPRVIHFKLSLGRSAPRHLSVKVSAKDTSGNTATRSASVG